MIIRKSLNFYHEKHESYEKFKIIKILSFVSCFSCISRLKNTSGGMERLLFAYTDNVPDEPIIVTEYVVTFDGIDYKSFLI